MSQTQERYTRTIADVKSILNIANIDLDTLLMPPQVLHFSDGLKPSILLELDAKLSQAISLGQTLQFQGKLKDKLILCTNNKTYDVKSAQTSNSILVVSDLKLPDELGIDDSCLLKRDIFSVHHSYLEVKDIKPNIKLIRVLLDENAYKGPELEPDGYTRENGFFTTKDLLEEIQISEEELSTVLNNIDALEIQGFWRSLSFEYHFRALSYLVNLVEENSWGLSSIPIEESLTVLRELLPNDVADHIFSIYCTATGAVEDGEQIFELNQRKVCRYLAAALLSHADKFNLDDFMVAWRQGVPEGMDVKLDMINDMMIIERDPSSTAFISYFPEHELSENIYERFKQLFIAKSTWHFEEIEPFLRKLSSEKQDVKALLTKYTRTSMKDNVVHCCAKYGK